MKDLNQFCAAALMVSLAGFASADVAVESRDNAAAAEVKTSISDVRVEPSADSADEYYQQHKQGSSDLGGQVFISGRLGLIQSLNTDVSRSSGAVSSDAYDGMGAGLRVGYLLGSWRSYLEYNPVVEVTLGDSSADLSSIFLATEYAVWQSDNQVQRVSLGGFAGEMNFEYTVDENGAEYAKSVEADGVAIGLSAAYRWNFSEHLFFGADLQYGFNGVKGSGAPNDTQVRVNDFVFANLELGYAF
jgi:hypothetical protein